MELPGKLGTGKPFNLAAEEKQACGTTAEAQTEGEQPRYGGWQLSSQAEDAEQRRTLWELSRPWERESLSG